jgi:hypothetical protein
MKSLIIPMGGKSSRFPDLRPKWMLTHPMSGSLMCIESIKGLNIDFFDKIYFTFLKKHEDDYKISTGLKNSLLELNLHNKVHLTIIDETNSQSETVYKTIINNNITGFIFIKDSDSFFDFNIENEDNQICCFNLNNIDNINARSKSYLSMDKNNIISNIVEKKVISPYFSVGGYGFNSSHEFCKVFEKISNYPGECYISNIIFEMLLDGQIFKGVETSNFIDWGTINDWREYCRKFSTIFVDLDGTLVTNTSHLIPPYIGDGIPLLDNIKTLRDLYNNGQTKIIITTSRPESYKDLTIEELNKFDIKYDQLIMGLPHAKRILINDFSKSNTYPTSISINIDRNSDTLKNFLK